MPHKLRWHLDRRFSLCIHYLYFSLSSSHFLFTDTLFVCFLFNRLFVRFHLSCAEDTLATIEEIVGGAMTELIQDEDKNACSATYPTLTRYSLTLELIKGSVTDCANFDAFSLGSFRSSVACYYRTMMEELIASVKQTHSVPLRRTDSPEVRCLKLKKVQLLSRACAFNLQPL